MDKIAFPVFDAEQIKMVAEIGVSKTFAKDDILIRHGEKDFPLFVLQSGSVRIVEMQGEVEHLVTHHQAGEFTGDVDMLTGRMSIFSAIANERVEAFELSANRLRTLLIECPDVSELLLDAFQQRRKLFREADFVGVRMIGNTGTAATSRIQELFYKNHVPHSFVDAESEEGRAHLETLNLPEHDLPILQCNNNVLSNPSLLNLSKCIGITAELPDSTYDLVVVGAGPAGLAPAVYAASEGRGVPRQYPATKVAGYNMPCLRH